MNRLFAIICLSLCVAACGGGEYIPVDAPDAPASVDQPAPPMREPTPHTREPRTEPEPRERPARVSDPSVTPGPGADYDEACVDDETFFIQEVWTPLLSTGCIVCHNPLGAARNTGFVLRDGYQTGFLQYNFDVMKEVATYQKNGEPLVLVKPLGLDAHGGGVRLQEYSAEYLALVELLERFDQPTVCDEQEEAPALFDQVALNSAQTTLRRARLALTDQLPTQEEIEAVDEQGLAGLEAAIKEMMHEEAFYDRLRVWFNDAFLTDAYLPGTEALDRISVEDYPDRDWYLDCDVSMVPECEDPDFAALATEANLNQALAREPLELIVFLVKHNRPFTELVTAPYIMVNPLSAVSYGTSTFFVDPLDLDTYRPAELTVQRDGETVAIPHAGVLTSPMVLNRFPTTETNVNRHRAWMAYDRFLATDVLRMAERPLDQATIMAHNPTMNEAACSICHAALDPVAGAFQNWDENGRYLPPAEGWIQSMRSPGLGSEVIPLEDTHRSLQWLGERLAADRRFVTAVMHVLFEGLTGQAPMTPPADPAEADYTVRLNAYLQQDSWLRQVGDEFIEAGYDLRVAVHGLVMSPWFRAENLADAAPEPDEATTIALEHVGMARLLTPEQLGNRIEAVIGSRWIDAVTGEDALASTMRVYYGGIDSMDITRRAVDMDGVMANVAERMANEVACMALQDFALPTEERLLFPMVEVDYVPEQQHGFAVPEAEQAIRDNIAYLHERILGETLEPGDEELEATWNLWRLVWKTGLLGLENGKFEEALPEQCAISEDMTMDPEYTVRAWMAVVSYLLADAEFLYE